MSHPVKELPPFTNRPAMGIDPQRLEAAFDRAIEFRRACEDPHGIANAVMLALAETRDAILNSLKAN